MKKINFFLIFNLFIYCTYSYSSSHEFSIWLTEFNKYALNKGITEKTLNEVMTKAKFLPKVIEYDRYQPEFYEDTFTYIKKRTGNKKIKKGLDIYNSNKNLINRLEKDYYVEKELLLSLMGIETNFGTYLGKMDIISSLATLSFDKRRSKFFTNELITILKLIDKKVIEPNILYGSWAGAFGNFQFMPTTIRDYAIDYDSNNVIDLKSINDSFASAANYIHLIGWKKNEPCYKRIELNDTVPKTLLNTSAKKIKNKKKLKHFKSYIQNYEKVELDENIITAIITPDKDIVPEANDIYPAFLVFDNYEIILQWNRSLRFALAVCKLKEKFSNEL